MAVDWEHYFSERRSCQHECKLCFSTFTFVPNLSGSPIVRSYWESLRALLQDLCFLVLAMFLEIFILLSLLFVLPHLRYHFWEAQRALWHNLHINRKLYYTRRRGLRRGRWPRLQRWSEGIRSVNRKIWISTGIQQGVLKATSSTMLLQPSTILYHLHQHFTKLHSSWQLQSAHF